MSYRRLAVALAIVAAACADTSDEGSTDVLEITNRDGFRVPIDRCPRGAVTDGPAPRLRGILIELRSPT